MKLFNFKKGQSASKRSDLKAYKGLVYAVGDVHGRSDLLEKLLQTIASDIESLRTQMPTGLVPTMVFLGDYIDRGLQSKSVIEQLAFLSRSDVKTVFLLGNHEQTALKFLQDAAIGVQWSQHGAIETLASYGISIPDKRNDLAQWEETRCAFVEALPENHLDFLKSLKLYWIEGPFMFVHAGVDPAKPIDAQGEDEFLWVRDQFIQSRKRLAYTIVHGHTPEMQPVWDGRRIGVDTGAYMTGKLTAVRIYNADIGFLST